MRRLLTITFAAALAIPTFLTTGRYATATPSGGCSQSSTEVPSGLEMLVTCHLSDQTIAQQQDTSAPSAGRSASPPPSSAPRRTPTPTPTTPAPVNRVTYCEKNVGYITFPEIHLTITAGIPCRTSASSPAPSASPTPAVINITAEQAAQVAIARLNLQAPKPHKGPDWTKNSWNALAVGYPTWTWVTPAKPLSAIVTVSDITITLSAPAPSLTIDNGDGSSQDCTNGGTPITLGAWRQARNHESPTCGHTYAHPGTYPVTTTATWNITWSGLGQTGTVTLAHTSQPTDTPIAELEAVLINP